MNKFMEMWDKVETFWYDAVSPVKALIVLGIVVGAILVLVLAGFVGPIPFFVVLGLYSVIGLYFVILMLID